MFPAGWRDPAPTFRPLAGFPQLGIFHQQCTAHSRDKLQSSHWSPSICGSVVQVSVSVCARVNIGQGRGRKDRARYVC